MRQSKPSGQPRGLMSAVVVACVLAAACESRPPEAAPSIGTIDSLPSPAGPRSGEPNVSAGPDGRVWMSWLEQLDDSLTSLKVAAFNGTAWSAPVTVVSRRDLFVNWADFPSVYAGTGNRLVAHWLQRSDTGRYAYEVRVSQSADDGATWSPAIILHRDKGRVEHGFLTFFAAAADSVAAVWLDGRKFAVAGQPHEMQLATTTIASSGSLGAESMIDERICDCCQTDVAMTPRGPVVVYRDRSDAEIRDIYALRREGPVWTTPVVVHNDNWKIAGCPVNGPAVAARGDTVAVAWFTAAHDTARVRVAFSYDAGATFNAPFRIDGGLPIGRVDVQLDDSARAIVAWLERTDSARAELRLRAVSPNGALSAPVTLAQTSGARASGFPRMTLQRYDNEQALLAAWTIAGDSAQVHVARVRLR